MGKRVWSSLGLIVALLALELTARGNADPDYWLPDPFRGMAIGLLFFYLVTGLLRFPRARSGVRLVLLVATAAVLILEWKAAANNETSQRIEISDDALVRYHYQPGIQIEDMTVNSAGFLDEEWVVPKPEGVIRIAVLTGSIANDGAIPFEDRFFRVLERLLTAAAPGVEVEVLNLSCEGHNTLQQVRRLEQVGLQYEPDLVFVGFMVTAAGFQNGGHRRIGNSYFAFRFIPMLAVAHGGSICSLFSDLYETYTFDLIVGNSLERLKLLSELHGFETAFAPLPMLEEFTHPACQALYTRATDVARAAEYDIIPVVERFEGRDFWDFVKEGSRWDFAHPNVAGHLLIGEAIAEDLGPWVREQTAVAP